VPDLLPATTEMEELCVGIAEDLHEVRALIGAQPAQFVRHGERSEDS
jgi:hypothetical protein